jgi:hypothetical protein
MKTCKAADAPRSCRSGARISHLERGSVIRQLPVVATQVRSRDFSPRWGPVFQSREATPSLVIREKKKVGGAAARKRGLGSAFQPPRVTPFAATISLPFFFQPRSVTAPPVQNRQKLLIGFGNQAWAAFSRGGRG